MAHKLKVSNSVRWKEADLVCHGIFCQLLENTPQTFFQYSTFAKYKRLLVPANTHVCIHVERMSDPRSLMQAINSSGENANLSFLTPKNVKPSKEESGSMDWVMIATCRGGGMVLHKMQTSQ